MRPFGVLPKTYFNPAIGLPEFLKQLNQIKHNKKFNVLPTLLIAFKNHLCGLEHAKAAAVEIQSAL